MPKKIYDIKPPKVAKKVKEETKIVLKKQINKKPVEIQQSEVRVNEIKKNEIQRNEIQENENHSNKWIIPVVTLLIIAFVGVYLFFKLPKADIAIWPKVETLSFKQTLTADKIADSINVENNIIPAKYFQATKTNSQDFPATGNASNEGKAEGNITVYNKYDPPDSFTFKVGTRFISDSGKLFVTLQKVVVPAAKKSGSKITPGSIQIKVQAVEGGSDYNIAPASFSIPGLKGTSSYYSVYATSTSAMAGGYTGKIKKVTDDDIQGAKDILTKKTTEDAMADLKSQIPSDYILLDNAALSNVSNASTKIKSGTVTDNFNYEVTVNANALAFKKSDIDQFAKDYIISQIPEGKTLLDNTFKNDYSASVVDVSGGKATINLNCSSGIYQNIDKNSVALSLFGTNENQINQTLNNLLGDQLSKVQVDFWPFWVKAVPNNQKAINIELKF